MKTRRQIWAARALVALHIICISVPLAIMVAWAFANSWPWPDLLPHDFSLRGFEAVLRQSQFSGLSLLLKSVGISLVVALLTTLIATLAARAICLYEWPGKTLVSFATILPFLVPTTVFAMGVQVLFIKLGLARTVIGVVIAHAIVALPYAITFMVEITSARGDSLERAATTLGASPLRAFYFVSLPLLLPGLLASLSMSYIISFSQYFLTLIIGGGAVQTYATVMFPYFAGADRTIASSYGVGFIAGTFIVFLVFELLLRALREKKPSGQ